MSDARQVPGSNEEWLRRAKADLALARTALPEGGVYEDLSFHAQQAAEKAIKAVYVKLGSRFAYTRDIAASAVLVLPLPAGSAGRAYLPETRAAS